MSTTLVTVTYGDRWPLLKRTLSAAQREGVTNCIVVDNGSIDRVKRAVDDSFNGWATVIEMGQNTGSAKAYKCGISEAVDQGGDFILLLDDDNLLGDGCLTKLQEAYREAAHTQGDALLAVCGFRADHAASVAQRVLNGVQQRTKGAWLGFHVFDVWKKIKDHTNPAPVLHDLSNVNSVRLPYAPYGGLLFHRTLIDKIGLPDEAYFLYQDDIDFTYRITKMGGIIMLIPNAEIFDIQDSWNVTKKRANAFKMWLTQSGDTRCYYAYRNAIYFEWYKYTDRSASRFVNAFVYIVVLAAYAVFLGKLKRFWLLMVAAYNGLRGKLGVDADYPLPK